jgi:carboxylesterase 2
MKLKYSLLSSTVWSSTMIAATAQTAPTVTVSSGPVEGTALASNVKAFLGIPFAQSPPLRFGAPVDPKSWTTPLKATAFKPACVQQFVCEILDCSTVKSVTNDSC